MPTWSNDFESGPPKIEGEELAKVDGVSRAHEIERLTKMKVLNKLPKDADLTKYKFLSPKVVYDWRHRESEWRRRGRLVAREFSMVGRYRYCKFVFPNRCGKHGEVTFSVVFVFRRILTRKH